MGYEKPKSRGDYGIDRQSFYGASLESANIVFLHATTRDDKLYPEAYWRELAKKLIADGYRIRLVWGEEHEHARALRIAEGIEGVEVLPRLNLHGVACVLAQASAVVAVDTGLGHLTAALNIPAISLYGPTNPDLVGAYGENQFHICSASDQENKAESGSETESAGLAKLEPDTIYDLLQRKILAQSETVVFQKLS